MLAAGRIDASQLGGTLFTWWLGDTLGVILVLPLMLVLFKPLRESWMPPIRRVAVPLLVISLVALAAFRAISHNEQQHQQSTFVQFAEVQRRSLQASLDSAVDALHALRGFVQTTPQITPSTFERFTRELLGFNPGLQGLSWNPVVGLEERAGFEQRMQQLHGSPFMLTERGPTGGLVRAAERPRYVVAAFVEPAQQNRAALGFDVLSIPSRESALRQALDSGRPVPTTALRLVTETDGQASVLVFLPVFADGPADGSAPDWQQLRGSRPSRCGWGIWHSRVSVRRFPPRRPWPCWTLKLRGSGGCCSAAATASPPLSWSRQ
ncbi:CHASE domain-containing protein [Marinobacterium aestuariivivens]|uniref:CHASE domain-containing protein n=1 Tax=Marinobacterium aestuariivivens TaxID=1698799 RepID=A0ABW1ZZE6_9GAMM